MRKEGEIYDCRALPVLVLVVVVLCLQVVVGVSAGGTAAIVTGIEVVFDVTLTQIAKAAASAAAAAAIVAGTRVYLVAIDRFVRFCGENHHHYQHTQHT